MSAQELSNLLTDRRSKIVKLPKIDRNLETLKPVAKRRPKSQDTCAICLEEFSCDNDYVTYCKYSCGNIVHSRCIQMLLKHTSDESDKMLKCPLCRGNFNTISSLKQELKKLHKRVSLNEHTKTCTFCQRKPILGNLYRCLECDQIYLCNQCLNSQDFRIYHGSHNYAVKKKSGGPWRRLGKVEEHLKAFNRNGNFLLSPSLPSTSKTKNLLEFSKGFSFNCDGKPKKHIERNNTVDLKTDRKFVQRNYLCAVCTDIFEGKKFTVDKYFFKFLIHHRSVIRRSKEILQKKQ